jgi:hypothetical protein
LELSGLFFSRIIEIPNKKLMHNLVRISWGLFISSLVIRIISIPGSSLLLVLSVLLILISQVTIFFNKGFEWPRKISMLALSLFAVGLIFKIQYYPGGAILLLVSILTSISSTIYHSLKSRPFNLTQSLFHISGTIFLTYIVFRLQYWPFAFLVFSLGIVSTALALVFFLSNKESQIFPKVWIGLIFLTSMTISNLRGHHIYHFIHSSIIENYYEYANPSSFVVIEKYSWFLYIADEHEKALEANAKAIKMVETALDEGLSSDFQTELSRLQIERIKIIEKNWTNYD